MFRVAVIQNQSESQRSGYANVARNLAENMPRERFEFRLFDASNIERLFVVNGDDALSNFDGVFISTNVTSDRQALEALNAAASEIADFLASGKGIFVSYQKKMTFSSGSSPHEFLFLPERYRVHMVERPKSEADSGQGEIAFVLPRDQMNTAAYLLVSSPNEVSPESVKLHCLENDFKAHLYRSIIRPANSAAFDAVFCDPSFDQDQDERHLFLVNRSGESGERVVISTIAIDWESHLQLLENVLEYIAAGVPRLAFVDSPTGDSDIDFIQSTARLAGISSREYQSLDAPTTRLRAIHDVYVLSSHWSVDEARAFWDGVSKPRELAFRHSADFQRLYHLGDHSAQALTRYVNYTSLDAVLNESVLWIEAQYSGGFWGGGFWNSHDALYALDSLRVDVASYLAGILSDVRPHLRDGAYDGVMGPTCGLLALLNRLVGRYESILEAEGFGFSTRRQVAAWICRNAPAQSEIARQVASQAIFSPGGADVVASLKEDPDLSDEITALGRAVRQSDYTSVARVSGYTNLDLARLLDMVRSSETIDQTAGTHVQDALVNRQREDGTWGSTTETASVLAALLESGPQQGTPVYEAVLKAVDALRGRFSRTSASWGKNLQETSACVRALGLFNDRIDLASQEVLETIELQRLASNRASTVGQARVDLASLFDREDAHIKQLIELNAKFEANSVQLARAEADGRLLARKSNRFRVAAVVSLTILLGVVGSLLIKQPSTLINLLDAASLFALLIGALIAVPITIWLTPRQPKSEVASPQRSEWIA